jgi:hypothetical protein
MTTQDSMEDSSLVDETSQDNSDIVTDDGTDVMPDLMTPDSDDPTDFFGLHHSSPLDTIGQDDLPQDSDTLSDDSGDFQPLGNHHDISFGSAYTPEQYREKADDCYKEYEHYIDMSKHAEDKYEVDHYLKEAEKWRERGDEYTSEIKYAEEDK